MKNIITKLLKKSKDKKQAQKEINQSHQNSAQNQKIASNYKYTRQKSLPQQSQQEEQEILNSLINMCDHLKISKINRQLQGEYLTLCHINRILCQQIIQVREIRQFLLHKCENLQFLEQSMQKKQQTKVISSKNKAAIQYYTNYSNGLIFQYYSIRALLWKICLRYIPSSKNKWISYMQGKMIEYHEHIKEHIIEILMKKKTRKQPIHEINEKIVEVEQKKTANDHPLNLLKQSKWKTFFDDKDLWNIIEKDTIRTKPQCKFFQEEYQIEFRETEIFEKYQLARSQIHLSKLKDKQKTYYYDCLTRIIYIFLKINPQFTYCQGMNQLAAIIFYSFANKNSEYFRRVAQSDAYFCFQKIMKSMMKQGSNGFLNGEKYSHKFQDLLKKVDLRLYECLLQKPQNMNSLKILSIKWFNSLFLAEFEIDESLILWDSFISIVMQTQGQMGQNNISFSNLLVSLGLSVVHLNRNSLSKGQNPMSVLAKITNSPENILEKALNLYKIFHQYFQ